MNTKEKIIEISLKSFLMDGYDDFSMRDVGKEVGIKQPTIYYYFDDKLSLFKVCVRYFFKKWNELMIQFVPRNADLKELIKSTCTSFGMDSIFIDEMYGVKTNTGQYRLIFDILKYCPECLDFMKQFNEEFYILLEKATEKAKEKGEIRKKVTSRNIYFLLSGLIEGSYMLYLTDPDIDVKKNSKDAFEIIWNGIKNQEDKI